LAKPVRNEKAIVASFFEREVKRIQYVQERKRIRNQQKADHDAAVQEALAANAKAKSEADAPPPPQAVETTGKTDDVDAKEEEKYRSIEKE
jgi:hypothetical protein